MTRIIQRAQALLPIALHPVVQARMDEGRQKYGQELDEWPGTPRRAAIMRLQELLDGVNYALFEGDEAGARADAEQAARILERWPDLAPEEMGVRETTVAAPDEAQSDARTAEDVQAESDALAAEAATYNWADNGLHLPLAMLSEMLDKQARAMRAVDWWREQVAERRALVKAKP